MDQQMRPFRSMLYIPGSRERALVKAQALPADAIIFDLEDAVSPDEKPSARDLVARMLETGDFGLRALVVRINGLDTVWGQADAAAMAEVPIHALLIPKVSSAADVEAVARIVPVLPLWAMMETARGVLNAGEIASHPRLTGMVMGTNDLARELGCRDRADRLPLQASLGYCLLAARAHGVAIIDGVFNAFRDEAGLRAECEQGRDLGFDGKTLIHPYQLATANEVFAPTDADVALARRQIEAFGLAQRSGQGVAVLDGRIVENLHIVTAKATLARAEAIAAMAHNVQDFAQSHSGRPQ